MSSSPDPPSTVPTARRRSSRLCASRPIEPSGPDPPNALAVSTPPRAPVASTAGGDVICVTSDARYGDVAAVWQNGNVHERAPGSVKFRTGGDSPRPGRSHRPGGPGENRGRRGEARGGGGRRGLARPAGPRGRARGGGRAGGAPPRA